MKALCISVVFVILLLTFLPSAAALAGAEGALSAGAEPALFAGAERALLVTNPLWETAGPQAEPPLLPDVVQLVVGAAVTFLVVNGLKDFGQFVGQDLSGWGTVIAAGVTAIVVFSINTLLQVAVTIDPSLVPKVNAFLQILMILFGAMGFKRMQRGGV